jgi:hypothetical protein
MHARWQRADWVQRCQCLWPSHRIRPSLSFQLEADQPCNSATVPALAGRRASQLLALLLSYESQLWDRANAL